MKDWPQFPEITTDRLVLRQFTQHDLPQVYFGLSHPDVIKYYGVSYHSLEATQEQIDWYRQIYEKGTGVWWAITQKENRQRIIGACGFNYWSHLHNHAEMGYWLLPEDQRKGYMSEAIEAIIPFGFNSMKLHRIVANVEKENMDSIWLLEKMHFVEEGVLKEAEYKNGKYIDLIEYALINPHN